MKSFHTFYNLHAVMSGIISKHKLNNEIHELLQNRKIFFRTLPGY